MTAAAQSVGVATSTLRAWEHRYGMRPTGRTAGGHRRYSRADVGRLQRMQELIEAGVPAAHAAALTPAHTEATASAPAVVVAASRFREAVEALAGDRVRRAAIDLFRRVGVVPAWEDTLTPYLQALGREWARSGDGVDREHVAVAALQSALRMHVARRANGLRSAPVFLAAVPGEHHTLPLDALAAALAEQRIATAVLYDLPSGVLPAAVQQHPGAVTVLWSRCRADVPALRSLGALGSPVYAAGPGWRRARLPDPVRHLPTLSAAVAALVPVVPPISAPAT